MENKVKIIHLYDTTAIAKNWHFFVEGVEKVLDHSEKDMNITFVYNNLMAGRWYMFTVFNNNKYVGFFIVKEDSTPFGERNVIVVQCYLKPGTDKNIFGEVVKECEELAKKSKCQKVKCYSLRKGMEKFVKPFGYKTGYIEYYKEVADG